MPEFVRPCHINAHALLSMMDAVFLTKTGCRFGGGTRMSMELGEYRASEDVDMLCANPGGWRMLRQSVFAEGIDGLFSNKPKLLRELRNDRYGIRCLVEVNEAPLKVEFIHVEQPLMEPAFLWGLAIPLLAQTAAITQKLLALASRGADASFHSRDLIDLAYARSHWGEETLMAGWSRAVWEYGGSAIANALSASIRLFVDAAHQAQCAQALDIDVDDPCLWEGLKALNVLGAEPVELGCEGESPVEEAGIPP